MARIVIAGSSEQSRTQVSRLLASSGYPVFRICANAGELRRVLNETEDGVLILAGRLPDYSPDEVAWDYGDRVQILLIARTPVLEECESPEVFHLALPVSGQTVIGSVEMLTQLHQMRMPRRAGADRQLVEKAKRLMMRQEGLTEAEAHRMLQRYAMNHGMKMTDYAARILEKHGSETEE